MARKGKRKPPPLADELEAKMREQYDVYYPKGGPPWEEFVSLFPLIDDAEDQALGDAYRELIA